MVPLGEPMVPLGEPMVPLGDPMVPLGEPMLPLGEPMVPLLESTNGSLVGEDQNHFPPAGGLPPRGPFLDQDGAHDRQEEPQGDHFRAKMVSKIAKRSPKGSILGPRLCPRSLAKLFKAKVTKSVRMLFKNRI